MKLSQFKYRLDPERIAQHPTPFRDDCRLMVVHAKSGTFEHRDHFYDIMDYFDEKDVFVFNDTKVFPARLYGNKEKTGARIEVFLLRELNPELRLWDVLVDPARKIRIGNKLYFGEDNSMVAEVIDNTTSRGRTLRFLYDGPHDEFKRALYALGEAPLPRSILSRPSEPCDIDDFQTIFASKEGAVTAPSACLHFSRSLMKRLELKGVDLAYITMHCGLGSFREIDVEDLTKHKMDSEEIHVSEEACRLINGAHDTGHRVCAIGTTVQRVLETAVSADEHLKPFDGWTNKFIFPPHKFVLADAMVANFYMPYSTLLMLTAAYGGYELIMRAYEEALQKEFPVLDLKGNPMKDETTGEPLVERYRFGTYGDAMLILQD
ncbi:MAG: tRNA preQ1(34) S-adenosylmethionine ribosyltransferase-isomerase QueA [Bacteroidales bacterium]|nr:tRNA preQ1(34) S-adenosylmethionine ribosyltransferase-isomerase QueA [Candidatus Physcousia equi]